MLKEILSKKSSTVNNAIITLGDTDDSGKGRHFKSRFIQPGVAGYPGQFGNVLIKKESFDKFIDTMVGVPVIINHKDITAENADDERVGVVSNVWYDDKDGWYWCDGIIWDETAQNLITDNKWSVSCSYDVKTADDKGGSENNIKYDMEFLDGVFTHLALVDNPRYERANIVFNGKMSPTKGDNEVIDNANDEKGRWITVKGTPVFIPDGANQEEVVKEFLDKKSKEDKAKWKSYDEVIDHAEKQLKLVESKLKEKNSPEKHEKLVGDKINLEDKIKYYKSQKGNEDKKETSETNSQKDFKNHLDRIEKQIKKYNLEPREEEELLDELGSFEAKLDEGLEPREEEKLREELLDFEEDIKRHQEMKKDEGDKTKGKSQKQIDKELTKIVTDRFDYIKTLETQESDSDDFHEVSVWGLKEILSDAFKSGSDGKGKISDKQLEKIAKESLNIETLKERGSDSYDFPEVSVWGLKEAMTKAYKLGEGKSNNSKEDEMALIEELKKLISKVENDKGEKMEDKEKIENEKVDKRELIDEVGGILKGKVDDEVIRTIIGKLEKVAYDKSEAGSADNEKEEDKEEDKKEKVENESEEDKKEVKEIKEEEKKDVENKCKNSKDGFFEKMNQIYNSAVKPSKSEEYVSRADRLKAGEEYFKV